MQRTKRNILLALGLYAAAALGSCGDDDGVGLPPSGSFRALTYNVAGLPEGISGSHPSRYTQIISPRLNAYDLVLVQESWLEPVPYPSALLGLHLYHQVLAAGADHPYKSEPLPIPLGKDPGRPGALVSDGLNLFARYPFEPLIRQRWEECDNSAADCLSLKGFCMARTEVAPGVTIDVYDLHMEAGNTENDRRLKRDNVLAMADFIRHHSAGRAVIVGGDFNLHADRPADAAILDLFYAAADLTDACAALGCPEPGRIDKFLFRDGERVRVRPLQWSNEDARFRTDDGKQLSDHEPVAVVFEWTGR